MNIKPIVEFLNNILFLASAYNQIWTIKTFSHHQETGIAIIDERTEEVKLTFHNVDELMRAAIIEIKKEGWETTRRKFLIEHDTAFCNTRVHLCDAECECDCHNT